MDRQTALMNQESKADSSLRTGRAGGVDANVPAIRSVITGPSGSVALCWTARGGPLTGTIDCFTLQELARLAGLDAGLLERFSSFDTLWLQPGPWQSWSAGWELERAMYYPRKVRLLSPLNLYNGREGDLQGRHTVIGHFVAWLRSGDEYLCLAAEGFLEHTVDGGSGVLPPLSFRFERAQGTISIEILSAGEDWTPGAVLAQLNVFHARGAFALKDRLRRIYRQERRFDALDFLCAPGTAGQYPLPRTRVPGGYESWYNHYTHIDEELLRGDLEALGTTDNLLKLRYLDRGAPLVFQIDDGWERCVGEWESRPDTFPSGMAVLAAAIETHGFVPGLWLAPFLVTKSSAVYRDHPDWLLKRRGGKPFVCGFNDKWDGAFYCLDLSRADVLEYLDSVMKRVVEDWGFRYLKLDFMYAGLLEGAFDYGGAAFRHYERALDVLVRRTQTPSGQPVAYLGCGIPFQASYRHFPLSRIGADTKEDWDWPLLRALNHAGRPAALINLRDTLGRSFLDGAVFVNDPDVVFLREENCRLSEGEKELIALVNYLFASQIMFSDNPARFGKEAGFTARIAELYENLDALEDEFAPIAIAPDVWRVASRSGRLDGIVNLRDVAVDVSPYLDDAGRISLDRRDMFLDRRATAGEGLTFQPRSISLLVNK